MRCEEKTEAPVLDIMDCMTSLSQSISLYQNLLSVPLYIMLMLKNPQILLNMYILYIIL